MWRRTYLILVLVRLWFALSPSYLHPDENFQGPEVIAGKCFVTATVSILLARTPSGRSPSRKPCAAPFGVQLDRLASTDLSVFQLPFEYVAERSC
jgi:hypothetical protein